MFSDEESLELFSGIKAHPNTKRYSHNYAGHQYGVCNYKYLLNLVVSQLGGGRAISMGEITTNSGERLEIQLKGTGPNCFSRGADGFCTLASCLIEFIIAEYASTVGIPSIRYLVVAGGAPNVWRKGKKERQGMVTRFAPSFLRFGSFELYYYRRDLSKLKELADFLIHFHYPDAKNGHELAAKSLLPACIFKKDQDILSGGELNSNLKDTIPTEHVNIRLNKYGALFRLIVHRTAIMVAHWQAQVFVHGLLNTDHMSILGVTMHTEHGVYLLFVLISRFRVLWKIMIQNGLEMKLMSKRSIVSKTNRKSFFIILED